MKQHTRNRSAALVGLAGALLLAGSAAASEVGRCLSADVPQAMVLPDGQRHPAGTVSICYRAKASPVAGFHEVLIDGRPVGRFIARHDLVTLAAGDDGIHTRVPYLVFVRNDADELELHSYHRPLGRQLSNHRLWPGEPHVTMQWNVVADAGEAPAYDSSDRVILVAAGPIRPN